jgi:hypothetical protein
VSGYRDLPSEDMLLDVIGESPGKAVMLMAINIHMKGFQEGETIHNHL